MKNKFLVFIVSFVLLIGLTSAISISYPKLSTGGAFSAFNSGEINSGFDDTMCKAGQDFIVQIDPMGCSPAVVRSDLLEEQDVPVFCKLQAIKINPIIDIEAINSLNLKSGDYSNGVKTVGFYPSKSALGENTKLNNLMWDDIGYAVIYLGREPNESRMPDFAEGNLTVRINYDLNNAFGLRYHTFYLPVMEDNQFERTMGQYAFFDKRGYLRAEDVTEDSASIIVYSGIYESAFGKSQEGDRAKQKIGGYKLKVGESTSRIYLPGFGCYAGVQFKLDNIEAAGTRARISINSELFEVKQGEKFLDDRCTVDFVEKNGINEKVRLRCRTDEKYEPFELNMNPTVKIKIGDEIKDVRVGDYLYTKEDGQDVYLAYADTVDDSYDIEKLRIFLVSTSDKLTPQKLGDNEILAASYMAKGYSKIENGGSVLNYLGAASVNFKRWVINGNSFKKVLFGDNFKWAEGDKTLQIIGFGDEENVQLTSEIKENYNNALKEYDLILSDYRQEKYPEDYVKTLGERAAYEKIYLANSLNQKKDMAFFCDEFKENYADSLYDISECEDVRQLSNREISSRDLLIDGEYKRIDLKTIIQPGFKEYGAEILIGGLENGSQVFEIGMNQVIYLDGTDYIRLKSLKDGYATIEIYVSERSTLENIQQALVSKESVLKMNTVDTFGKYNFNLRKVNLEKVAKVSVIPSVSYTHSEADFSFKVGIEKRAIKLSPEKTQERVKNLNETIEKLNKVSSGLNDVVTGLKTACLGTGTTLTLKNLVFGANGKTIARQEVMRGEGGWYEQCADLQHEGKNYYSVDDCLLQNADEIDRQVNEILGVMTEQNNNIKRTQSEFYIEEGGLFKEKTINESKFTTTYADTVKGKLNFLSGQELKKNGEVIEVDKVLNVLNKNGYENGMYDTENLKELELYSDLYSKTKDEVYLKKLTTAMYQIEVNAENYIDYSGAIEKASQVNGLEGMSPQVFIDEKKTKGIYQGFISPSGVSKLGSIPEKTPVQSIIYDHTYYYATLKQKKVGSNEYYILDIYDEKGQLISDSSRIKGSYSEFIKYDSASYKNAYRVSPKLTYYETDPYKGLPAVVPFDKDDGWYAYVKQSVSAFGNAASYDESARVNSFYLCNVGENGLADFSEGRGEDDICQMINVQTGQAYNQFPGLTTSQASKVIDNAVKAIEQASRAYKPGVKAVSILNKKFEVGSPAVGTLSSQCQDVMSPKDCQILFNVCDPVICPPSRCDFGGAYPVQDVVQSGIIGSIALCLPNYNEGIYAPVCLTGVKAGIDNLISVTKSYRDCLDYSLKTGETVGVCDEINSIYMCEFFWRQAIPLTKIAIPKIIGAISGENVRGGGEYSNFQAAFENAKTSIDYFTKNYAINSFAAFKARSQEDVGSAVCKNFISISYPQGQGVLDALTESDSPAQYSGSFDAISFTTATNPPIDHYKVYYHIFAGNDRGAYYKVYLRGGGSSYYGDTDSGRIVASGYIASGDYESQTVDFTAPAGYKEMCIVVNNDEKCGFKEVTTSFAKNYVKDQYLQSQINMTDIKSESECTSGSANIYSLLNPNLEEGVGDLIDPAIYNRGIIRICATDNPGLGTDDMINHAGQRWIEVGYCGNKNVKCWIDTESIDNSLTFETSVNESLQSLTAKLLDQIGDSQGFMNPADFASNVSFIEKETNPAKRLELIKEIFDKVYRNNHKAYLDFLKGNAFGELAKDLFDKLPKKVEARQDEIVDIKYLVSEEGFVSPIFEMQVYSSNNVCYKFFNGAWYWSNDCDNIKKGSVTNIQSSDGAPMVYSYSVFWVDLSQNSNNYSGNLDSNNKEIVANLKGKDYIEGIKVLVNAMDTNSRLESLSTQRVELTKSKIFNTKYDQRIYFVPKSERWYWSFDSLSFRDEEWISIKDLTLQVKQTRWNKFLTFLSPTNINFKITEVSDKSKILMNLLDEKNSDEGTVILFTFENLDINRLGKLISPLTDIESALETLDELESYYNQSPDSVLVLSTIENFLNKLIQEGLIDAEMEDLMGPAKKNPNFNYIREKLNGDKVENPVESGDAIDWGAVNSKCEKYAELFLAVSRTYDVPLNILVAVAQQESRCNVSAQSGSSYGLMQINPTYWCGKFGLDSDETKCKKELLENPEKNLNAGAQILKQMYSSQKDIYFEGCTNRHIKYNGWENALRQYNGWGCNPEYPAQDNYVENVMEIVKKISINEGSSTGINTDLIEAVKGITCTIDNEQQSVPVTCLDDETKVGIGLVGSVPEEEVECLLDDEGNVPVTCLDDEVRDSLGIGSVPVQPEIINEQTWTLNKAVVKANTFRSGTYSINKELANFIEELFRDGVINNVEYYKFRDDWTGAVLDSSDLKKLLGQLLLGAPHLTKDKISLVDFSEKEREILLNSKNCEACGEGIFNLCEEKECFALGIFNGENCKFEESGNDCISGDKSSVQTTICTAGQTKCESTTYFTCSNNAWVNQGKVNGKCGYTSVSSVDTRTKILDTIAVLNDSPYIKYNILSSVQRAEIDKSKSVWTWNGIPVIRDYDNSGSIVPNCFDSVLHIYNTANVEFKQFDYCLKDLIIDVDKDLCQKDLDLMKEQIESGDILSVRYYGENHNIMFVKWIDKNSGRAQVFDWIGRGDLDEFPVEWEGEKRNFRLFEADLSFNEVSEDYAVYAIGKPVTA